MEWLAHLISSYYSFAYIIVFFATIIEGDITLLVVGALTKGGYLSFLKVFLIGCVASVIHDIIFWSIGVRLSRLKKKTYLFFNLEKINGAFDRIKPVMGIFIIFSKFAWNFNRVVLVLGGYVGIPFFRFIRLSIPAAFLWTFSYLSLGYVFADQTNLFKQKIEYIGLLIAAIIFIIVLFELYLKKIIQRYFYQTTSVSPGHCECEDVSDDTKKSS